MAQLNTIDLSDTGQKIILYGPPKSGKTLLAGMVAKEFKVTWFDLEHGFLTLKQLPLDIQSNINLIRIPDDRINHSGITTMLHLTDGKPVDICDYHGGIGKLCMKCKVDRAAGRKVLGEIVSMDVENLTSEDVIVVDSLTQLTHSAMGLAFKGKQGDFKSVIKIDFKHFTAQGYFLDRVLTKIQQSKATWIVISHEESLEQEAGGDKIVPMAGTRNFSKSCARYFDHVVNLSIMNGRYNQNSNGLQDMKVLSGSRTGINLEAGITDGIIELIRSVKGSEQETEAKKNLGSRLGSNKVVAKVESKVGKTSLADRLKSVSKS